MKINFNGVIRDMTPEELKVFEAEKHLLESNKSEGDITERIKRLENDRANTTTELVGIKEALNFIKNVITALDKSNQEQLS